MNRLSIIAWVTLLSAFQLEAQGVSANFNPWSHNTTAVDAKGVRHNAMAYKGNPPWLSDRLSGPAPDYSVEERRMRHEGQTILRLTLDLKTGQVVKTSLLKPSRYPSLDRCAIVALSRWTWRPGRWKEIVMPVAFHIGDSSRPPPGGSIRLPRS
jgi:TonB family protein